MSQKKQKKELPSPQEIPLPEEIPLPNVQEEQDLMEKMGFSSFNTTKGKKVPGNNQIGAVHVVKKRRYRQYMNRKGGFNRPLDKVA